MSRSSMVTFSFRVASACHPVKKSRRFRGKGEKFLYTASIMPPEPGPVKTNAPKGLAQTVPRRYNEENIVAGGRFYGNRGAGRRFCGHQGIPHVHLYPRRAQCGPGGAGPRRRQPQRGGGHRQRGAAPHVCEPGGRHRPGLRRGAPAEKSQGEHRLCTAHSRRHGHLAGGVRQPGGCVRRHQQAPGPAAPDRPAG